jgi:hypothetical protein
MKLSVVQQLPVPEVLFHFPWHFINPQLPDAVEVEEEPEAT